MYRKSRTAGIQHVSGRGIGSDWAKTSESHSDVVIGMHAICLGAIGREVLQVAIDTWVPCCVSLLHGIDNSDPILARQKGIFSWQL
jgi:hypothetical protein